MKDFWNERFAQKEYVYGQEPNKFIAEQLPLLKPGTILFPAEGEGRNAVFAATLGWQVSAFDQSEAGRKKALQLAAKKQVKIKYDLATLEEVDFQKEGFDTLVLVYAHFPESERHKYHQKLASFLKKGGVLLLEGFSKAHTTRQSQNPQAGGPKDVSMLFTSEILRKDFPGFQFDLLEEVTTTLNEGSYHQGKAEVIRMVGIKK